MKKIGFDLYFDEAPLFLKVAKNLKNRYSAEISGITLGKRWGRLIEKYDIKTMNMFDFFEQNWEDFDISFDSLRKLEKQYGIPNLSSFIYADRFFSKEYNYEDALKFLVGHFLFFEKYFKELKPDAYIGPGIAFLSHLVSFHVANKYNIRHLSLVPIRSNESRFVAFNNYVDSWDSVNRVYEELKTRRLALEEKKYAEDYLYSFRQKAEKPIYMKFPRQSLKIRKEFIEEFVIRLKRYYIEGWRKCSKFDYITKNPFWYVWRDGKRIILAKLFRHLNIFDKAVENEPFFFFPLHLEPEASTLILAPYYVNQIATIANIAKSIPAGSRLYVKEHISSFGRRPLSYYKAIRRLPNVRLISPFEDSHELIKNALTSIVLSSTVGWEAILYEKPVIVLGNAFYNASGLAHIVKHPDEIPNAIEKYVFNYKADRESLLKFLVALKKGSHPGLFDVPHMHADNRVMTEENIEMLSNGIWAEITKE